MDRNKVVTKTAKGVTQVNQKSASFSKDVMKVLKVIDGKSNLGEIMEKVEMGKGPAEIAITKLLKDGFARIFEVRKDEADPFATEDVFDFTAPGKIVPGATQRVVASAANDVSELVRQQKAAENEKKAKEQAHEAARTRAKTEAEARARAEAEAKARAEAEQRAMEQARKAKEASERARAELDAKMREDEARRKALAEQQARAADVQKAEEEEESKRFAELRAKAEREANERSRAELEAKVREEQARRKALAEQQARAEAQRKVKEEEESRALQELRQKAEQEAKALAEARARAEAEAQALAKARAEADAAVKRQAKEASSAEAEMKARLKDEIESRIRQEVEELLRNESEEKTRAEMEAQIMAEARLAAKSELEERMREEREVLAQAEAEARKKAEQDQRQRADREAKLRAEAEARATAEGEARAKAEEEIRRLRRTEARVREESEAKAREQQEVAQRLEAQRQVMLEAQARAQVDAEEAAEGQPAKKVFRRRRSIAKPLVVAFVAALILGIVLLHVVPLRGYATKIERTMSGWLQDDVSITTLKFQAYPTPHLKFENLAVGKQLDAKSVSGRIYMDLPTLFGERPTIHSIELDNVSLTPEAVRRILVWGNVEGKTGEITSIRLRGVKLDIRPAIEPFEAELTFSKKGALTVARLLGPSGGWTLAMKPAEAGMDLDFTARNFTLPIGVPLQVSSVQMKGTLAGNQIVVPEFEAFAMEGKGSGSLRATWGANVRLESQLTLPKLHADQLIGSFTKNIAITGKLDGTFNVVAEAPTAEALFGAPNVKGRFKLSDGSLSNVDLVAVMQSDAAGQRAGVTKFNEISGEFGAGDHRSSFRQVTLQGGVLRGNGTFDVGTNGSLAGPASLRIRSPLAPDRGSFSVSGTVSRPIIKRGG